MSFLWKISSSDRLVIKNGFLSISAYYSRRSKSEEFESVYKAVLAKLSAKIKDKLHHAHQEGGPNWEIFNPNGNRFYLPNSLAPGWQNPRTTYESAGVYLEKLVDFDSKSDDKMHFSIKSCPELIRKNLKDVFPLVGLSSLRVGKELTMITLSYEKDTDYEHAAKNFVMAAHKICRQLHQRKHWADFMNPFSGKPFYYLSTSVSFCYRLDYQNLGVDKMACGLGVKYENKNNCLVISSTVDRRFSGTIFTDATKDKNLLLAKLLDYDEFSDIDDDSDDDMDYYSDDEPYGLL